MSSAPIFAVAIAIPIHNIERTSIAIAIAYYIAGVNQL